MTAIKLRPYQQQFIDNVRAEFLQGNKRVVGVAPCGAGKTIMTGWMIREAEQRNKHSLFFVHRHELIEQTSKTFSALDIPHGIISPNTPFQPELPVQIASVQTLARRLDKIPAPDFLICDECHHILADTYQHILDAFQNAFLLGVTATPLRTGGITLCDVFNSMVISLSVDDLINLGNLTHFQYFAPNIGVNLDNVRSNFGEFNNHDLEHALDKPTIIGGIVEHYLKLADNKSAICYCVNVHHSKTVAQGFRDAGINAAHCDGDTPKTLRASIVEDFRNGRIKVLCNAELFGEGFDVPNCQAVILARPTKSLTLFIQQAMRALRPDPNDPDKVAIIIDHVQNYLRHGLPNKNHNWSLEPNKDKIPQDAPLKICPTCHAVIPLGARICPNCGRKFNFDRDLYEHQGNLVKIDTHTDTHTGRGTNPASTVKHSFTKPEELLSLAKKRNYKIGWVALQSLKFARSYEDCLHIADVCGYHKGWAFYRWNEIAAQ